MIVDFAGTDPWLRSLAFVGIFVGAGTLSWWALSLPGAIAARQLTAAAAALATIPAAIVAPVQDGWPLTVLGLVSVAAFLVCAAVAVALLLEAQRHVSTLAATAAADSAAGGSLRARVAPNSTVTEALLPPLSEGTLALGSKATLREIGFVLDYSKSGRPYRLGADNRIGRDPKCALPIEDAAASQEHARIKLEGGRFVLYDLGSKNGTRLVRAGRRRRLGAPMPLADLDVIEIGTSALVFINVEAAGR